MIRARSAADLDWYACRWIVEEYHKVMKTGRGIESVEFTAEERLRPAIALVSVVAILPAWAVNNNRKHDHPPGLLVLWRGWTQLCAMTEGASVMGVLKCG